MNNKISIILIILILINIFALAKMETRLRYVESNYLIVVVDETGQKRVLTNREFQLLNDR